MSQEIAVTCPQCKGKGYLVDGTGKAICAMYSFGLSLLLEGGKDGYNSRTCSRCDGNGIVLMKTSNIRRY